MNENSRKGVFPKVPNDGRYVSKPHILQSNQKLNATFVCLNNQRVWSVAYEVDNAQSRVRALSLQLLQWVKVLLNL